MASYHPGDSGGGHVLIKVGYSVDDGRKAEIIDDRLPLLHSFVKIRNEPIGYTYTAQLKTFNSV